MDERRTSRRVTQLQVRLTATHIDELVAAYRAGATVPQLVARFGINRSTVFEHLKRREIQTRWPARKLTDANVQQAAALYGTGESHATSRSVRGRPEDDREGT